MSQGVNALILLDLCRKLQQLAQRAPLDLLPTRRYDISLVRRTFKGSMPPSNVISLRSFGGLAEDHIAQGVVDPLRRGTFRRAGPPLVHSFPASNHRVPFHTPKGAWQHNDWHSGTRRQPLTSSAGGIAQVKPDAVQEGRLVEFKHSKLHSLGLVLGPAANSGQWKVEDVGGSVYTVREKDVMYVLPGGTFTEAELRIIAAEASHKKDECMREALISLTWEVSEPGSMFTVPEMADLLFGSSSSAACVAAHRLLTGDRTYFKQVGRAPPVYVARQTAEVAHLKQQEDVKRLEEEKKAQFLEAVNAARSMPRAQRPSQGDWETGPHADAVTLLEAFALGRPIPGGDPGRAKALDFLSSGMGEERTPQGAAQLLQSCGYWPPYVQLNLLASGLTDRFTPDLEDAAAALLANPPEDPDALCRQDLTDLVVYTIDDASTTEIDDGLSAELLPGGDIRVWIHIADPTRWVALDDILDREARRRSKTLYLPTGIVSMFPLSLATGPFSLRQNEKSYALSVTCVINGEGQLLTESADIVPAFVTPTHRMTYDLVDEVLVECDGHEEPALHALAVAAERRKKYRIDAGAVEIFMPEPHVDVRISEQDNLADMGTTDETPAVEVRAGEALSTSPSRQLVAEMMILAGEAFARVGARLGVPMPYRGQPDPILPSEEEMAAIPPGPCRMVMMRSCMPRSMTCTEAPQRHFGLGLDAYAQVTSPIRRYGDLLVHWQLKAALRGEAPPLSAPRLAEILAEVGCTTQRVSKLERDAQSYWIAHYFKRAFTNDPTTSWAATFLGWFREEAGLGRVLVEDLGLESLVKMARPTIPGEKLRVRCSSADPLMGMFRLDEAADLPRGGGVLSSELD